MSCHLHATRGIHCNTHVTAPRVSLRCPQRPKATTTASAVSIAAPTKLPDLEAGWATVAPPQAPDHANLQPELITHELIHVLEAELDNGASVAALRRFNDNLRSLDAHSWEAKLRPVMNELAYNLESFNPAFTAVLLKVQSSIGFTDYVRRDMALKNLIQPLAGEYGMHNGEQQAKTHRELFSEFYQDLTKEPLEAVLAANPRPQLSVTLFSQMMRDLQDCGGCTDPLEQASYAMGYNLAIEYLADYEKTWMLDSFRHLDKTILAPLGRPLSQWTFLEVHAEGEAEHAVIGHNAVAGFVPNSLTAIVQQAMKDHDRDFARFYNALADLLR